MTQPFTPWQDTADYFLAPDGDIEEGGASWTLDGGAGAVEGNASSQVGGASDHLSMNLPTGSAATTSTLCIGVEHPTMRFFAKRTGNGAGSLLVEVLYEKKPGKLKAVKIGRVEAGDSWAPTAPLALVVNELADEHDNALPINFRFTPKGGSAWAIDNVYVDPIRTG